MPNGHGGVPFLGAPVVLAILAAAFGLMGAGWISDGACVAFAALAGWRLAYHLHLRAADEYSGAYTAADAYLRALLKYRIAAVIYAGLSAGAAFGLLWWRGLAWQA